MNRSMMAPLRGWLTILAIAAASIGLVVVLLFTAPEARLEGRFLVVPFGWARLLGAFLAAVLGIGLVTYVRGLMTRPGKAGQYALTAGTHLFMLGTIALVFYPIVYLLAVSFNRNNTLATALPQEGNLLVRAGVFPDPGLFSFVQYRTVLGQTTVFPFQWILIALAVLALAALIGVELWKRFARPTLHAVENARRVVGFSLFGILTVLIVSLTPGQFEGTSIGRIVLYIRNTLLVSGATGIMAVLLSTTAGYAFARLKFEGRYQTLLTFVFVQMFPGFMALVAIFYLMSALDLLNHIGLVLAYSGGAIAFAAWIFKGYLESISPSLEEAAMVDGATQFGAFWRIILPISVPMLLFIFLLQFVGTYSEFILANTLLRGSDNWTVGIALRQFTTNRFDTQWGALAASAVLGSLPVLAIFYAFQDALTGQYQAGGVKG